MTIKFDGRKIRDQIIEDLTQEVKLLSKKPVLTVIWIGDDFASARYIEAKERAADKIGINFDLIKYSNNVSLDEVKQKISDSNHDQNVTGIMVQLPISKHFDLEDLVNSIDPAKDIDALRFCSHLSCDFRPPVTLSIIEAIKISGVNLSDQTVTIIGKGHLVGAPMARVLEGKVRELRLADSQTPNLGALTLDADIIISATGVANLIRPKMIKNAAILVDAGTTEVGGKLAGDIDPDCYIKAAFYTPVPGGTGPVTVAMLMKNVVLAVQTQQNNEV